MNQKIVVFFLGILVAGVSVRFLDDYVKVGQELEARVNVYNNNPYDLDDVRVRFHIFGLTIMQSHEFDVDDYDNQGLWFYYRIPKNTLKGDYLVKITAENEDFRSTKYRFITVV